MIINELSQNPIKGRGCLASPGSFEAVPEQQRTPSEPLRLSVIAYGFSGTFKLRELTPCFAGGQIHLSKTQLVAEYGPHRYAVAFDFGALVFVNLSGKERNSIISSIHFRAKFKEPHPPLEQDFTVVVDPDGPPHGQVFFDRVLLPRLTPDFLEILTRLLAQSVAIDYYEEDLEEIMSKADRSLEAMKTKGRLTASSRSLVRFVGAALETRKQIISSLSVLDKPAATWESEALDHFYLDFRRMLEIDERYQSLDQKLKAIQETLELFLELSQSRRMLFLEVTIVGLIFFEITMSLWSSY